MNKSGIPFLTATELSEKIKAKEVSPVEATEAYLERAEELNPKLNAYITFCADEAMTAARAAELEIAGGHYRGPMHGVPVAVKDQILTKGLLTTAGSTILKDFVPDEDATAITKLNDAGAILLGKTNMTEFAITTNHDFPYGMMHNPWDLSRYSGSSSGGSAAATVAFMCATSLGEDTGGSVRGPASLCGLAGLRPTWGLVSRHGLLGSCWSMDTIGPMSRTVADCAMTLQAIAGHDPKDPYTSRAPAPDFSAALTGDLTGLRVGVVKERLHTEDVALDIRQAVAQGIEVIKGLGAKVEEVSMPMIVHTAAFSMVIGLVEGASVHREYVNNRLQEYQHEQRLVQLVGSLIPAHTYYKAQRLRQMWRAQMLETLEKYDVLVYPTGPTVAPTVPPATGLQNRADAKADLYGRRSFTHPVNLAGVPALSVNCGFTQDGLPIGMQIIGRLFEDATVLGVGHAYEQATEWHKRRPPI